jgi:hypothetical protein
MSWGFYFNMEKLALNTAQKHITNMSDNNYLDDIFLDESCLLNNLENGFVALTQLSCYFESFLNTIINSCMNYGGEILLKCSIEEKAEIIFIHYQKDWSHIKSLHFWASYRTATKIRNEMIHFKKTYIGFGSGIPKFKLGNVDVATYFTKSNIQKIYNHYIELCKAIAQSLNLSIYEDIDVFECEGRDGLTNYIFDPKKIEIDSTRFNHE